MASISYVGNFGPEHSTENHVKRALERNGHDVTPLQENDEATWVGLRDGIDVDVVIWTRTWHLPQFPQREALNRCRELGVPTVGYHLDRWFGLARAHQVTDEPFFSCDLVVTADGGHEAEFAAAGVNHLWMPPAVSLAECERVGVADPKTWRARVAFVGSYRTYHREWDYRRRLVNFLGRTYRDRFEVYPRAGQSIRGQDLCDLYATVPVIVGDSCLAPLNDPPRNYWSDRIPETLGRGGCLIHPDVSTDLGDLALDVFGDGLHPGLLTYPLGDLDRLRRVIDDALQGTDDLTEIAATGREAVLDRHTYETRLATLFDILTERGYLTTPVNKDSDGVTRVRLGEVTATLDVRRGTADWVGLHETWVEDVYRLRDLDVAGKAVIDVGANVGAVTCWAIAAGAQSVHAYEPETGNMEQLSCNASRVQDDEHAKTGEWTYLHLHPEAVSNFDGTGWLDLATLDPGFESLTPKIDLGTGSHHVNSGRGGRGYEVAVISLDTVIDRVDTPDIALLKVDCEGGEFPIFAGLAPETLARVERVVVEFHGAAMGHVPEPTQGWEHAFGDVVAALAEWGHVETLGAPSRGGMIWGRRYS